MNDLSETVRSFYCYTLTSVLLILDCLWSYGIFKKNGMIQVKVIRGFKGRSEKLYPNL